jgi:hypothetical protein
MLGVAIDSILGLRLSGKEKEVPTCPSSHATTLNPRHNFEVAPSKNITSFETCNIKNTIFVTISKCLLKKQSCVGEPFYGPSPRSRP